MSESFCAACPKAVGRSCCEPESPHELATLTRGDIARIRAATPQPESAFVELEPFSPEAAHAHAQLRPANANAVRDGVRRHLRAKGGACVFHRADSGCSLDAATRPLACRLYPFELDATGRIRAAIAGRCHAEESVEHLADLLDAFGLTPAKVRALHRQLLRELADE